MTVLEMQQYFETLLQTNSDIFNDTEKPDTDTILRYLNVAQIKYINDKYLSTPTFKDRVKILSGAINDFGTLVKYKVLTDGASVDGILPDYCKLYELDGTEWEIVKISGKIDRIDIKPTSDTFIDFNPFNLGEIDKLTTTSINIPILLVPQFSIISENSNKNIVVVYDKYTTLPSGATLIYLKEPDVLDLGNTCELASYLHEDIVKLAIQMFQQEKFKIIDKSKDKEDK